MNSIISYVRLAKAYVIAHKKEFAAGAGAIIALVALIAIIVFAVINSATKFTYQPANACDMLTDKEASELLGGRAILSGAQRPTLSGSNAVSKCGYTDGNPETENMIVAAIIVRSAVNDDGAQKNKTDFAAAKPKDKVKDVKDLGDSAYFNETLGQLNVLRGRDWIILSIGLGEAPALNTVEKAVELAQKVIKS